jgi:hypothetical protein
VAYVLTFVERLQQVRHHRILLQFFHIRDSLNLSSFLRFQCKTQLNISALLSKLLQGLGRME